MLVKLPQNMPEMLRVVEGLPKLTKRVELKLAAKLANKYLEIIEYHLEAQDLKWKPLAPEYKEWKRRNGLDTRIWMATGKLVSKIKVIKSGQPGKYLYLVGISGEKKHKSGLTAGHLAMVHEYGVPHRGIPARPLFRPSYWELRARLKVQLESLVRAGLSDELKAAPRVKVNADVGGAVRVWLNYLSREESE